ncbi:MAG TPA: alpha/beta hydrolase-fold protein [Negativicutes bacterium]
MKGEMVHTMCKEWRICIYLPPTYKIQLQGFPVVYIQDEGYLFRDHLNDLEEMTKSGKLQAMIFVGIKPNNRNNEYTPWNAKAILDQHEDYGGQGATYLNFLANDLKPYIDKNYNTLSSPENTGIAGASFGGLISMYAAYLHPEAFGRIASISGSFWYERFIEFMQSNDIVPNGCKIYMDVGTMEGVTKKSLQKNMVARNQEAYAILLAKGLSQKDCRFVMAEGAVHDRTFFVRRFPAALQWLFPVKRIKQT